MIFNLKNLIGYLAIGFLLKLLILSKAWMQTEGWFFFFQILEMLLSYFLDNYVGSIYSELSSKNIYYIHVLGSPSSIILIHHLPDQHFPLFILSIWILNIFPFFPHCFNSLQSLACSLCLLQQVLNIQFCNICIAISLQVFLCPFSISFYDFYLSLVSLCDIFPLNS